MWERCEPWAEEFDPVQQPVGLGEAVQAEYFGDAAAAGILSLVARERGIPVGLLLHRSRCAAEIAEARQLAMYLMHVVLQRPMAEVGAFFGRDRTTVSHACHCVEDRRDDRGFDDTVTHLEAQITDIAGCLPRWLGHRGLVHAAR